MNTISKAARALSALDLSAEFGRLEAISKERKETAAAYDRGKAKTIDLSQQLAKIREPHRDGQAEAKALRAGTDVAAVAPSEDKIRAEREAVRAGMQTLSGDLEALKREASEVQDTARAKIASCFDGVVASWEDETRLLMARLMEIFADARSVQAATSNPAATRLATALMRVVDEAAVSDLTRRSYPVPASSETADTIQSNRAAIVAAGGTIALQHRTLRM